MSAIFDFKLIFTNIPRLLKYLPITIEIAVLAYLLSLIIGFLVAIVKIKKTKIVYPLVSFYVSFARGTPVLVQLYATYYGIPMLLRLFNYRFGTELNVNFIPPILFALAALALNDAAYSSEIIRAALANVDKGQREAAISLGMTPFQVLWRITLPEALVVAVPPLGNSFISMIKGTSLVFTCAVVDMTAGGRLLASRNYRFFEMYISLAIIYWGLTLVVSRIFLLLEKKLKCNEREVGGKI